VARGGRDLLGGDPSVAPINVVVAKGKIGETAALAGIRVGATWCMRGVGPGLPLPAGGEDYDVIVMVERTHDPAMVGTRDPGHPKECRSASPICGSGPKVRGTPNPCHCVRRCDARCGTRQGPLLPGRMGRVAGRRRADDVLRCGLAKVEADKRLPVRIQECVIADLIARVSEMGS
jgi:hypothetical protein